MSFFKYGDVNSNDFGITVSGLETRKTPNRSGSFVSVPGMNGDLFVPNNRFDSVEITYNCFIRKEFVKNWNAFTDLIYAHADEYQRLEDTYNPEYYRMAMMHTSLSPDVGTLHRSGEFNLSFHCKPEKWLKSGTKPITYTANGVINNPTSHGAHPLIRVFGTGALKIGNSVILVSTAGDEYIDIDTQIEDAYEGGINRNNCIDVASVYGTIPAGMSNVEFTGFSKVEVIPRWWTV